MHRKPFGWLYNYVLVQTEPCKKKSYRQTSRGHICKNIFAIVRSHVVLVNDGLKGAKKGG